MENASKALLMAAGVLVGILILSLAVFLFVDFGGKSKTINEQITDNQLVQYNAQYTKYTGRDNITIYEVASVINMAIQNNEDYKDYSDFDNLYKVDVTVRGDAGYEYPPNKEITKLIQHYGIVNEDDGSNKGELKNYFKVTNLEYHQNGGRIKSITFKKN